MDATPESQLQQTIINLLIHYSFEADRPFPLVVAGWVDSYPPQWILYAIIEALYQGRYKAISVEQILLIWQRRDRPISHFSHEFERMICDRVLTAATVEECIATLTPDEEEISEPSPVESFHLLDTDTRLNEMASAAIPARTNTYLITTDSDSSTDGQSMWTPTAIIDSSNDLFSSATCSIPPFPVTAAVPPTPPQPRNAQPSNDANAPAEQNHHTKDEEKTKESAKTEPQSAQEHPSQPTSPIHQFQPTEATPDVPQKLKEMTQPAAEQQIVNP